MILRLVAPQGRILADDVRVASGVVARARGLLGYPEPGEREALLLPGAKQVHTFGMKYPIDVIFCGTGGGVLHVVRRLRPRRATRAVLRSRWAVEMHAGAADGVAPGDELTLIQSGSEERLL